MKLTVLTNVYNEEYLLPFWLEHHKKIFDHGIIIDYRSTDSSMEIVRKICPTWTIITTRNKYFEAVEIDREFMDIENIIDGYKIILNTTEFLVTSSSELRRCILSEKDCYYPIQCLTALSSENLTQPSTLKDMLEGFDRVELHRRCIRALHSYDNGHYSVGRHSITKPVTSYVPAYVIWFGFYPWNKLIIERKLQIKNNIPESDKKQGFGSQHLWTYEQMEIERSKFLNDSVEIGSVQLLESFLKQ